MDIENKFCGNPKLKESALSMYKRSLESVSRGYKFENETI